MGAGFNLPRNIFAPRLKCSAFLSMVFISMPENTATPLGDPNAGDNNPNLSVVPAAESPQRARGVYNKETEAELSKASEIFAAAQKPEYAAELVKAKISAAEVTGYVALAASCGQKAEKAVDCDKSSEQATLDQAKAEQELVDSMRTIQGAARQRYLPGQPAELEKYLVGERLDASRPILERSSQTLINKANADRPGSIDTNFITKTEGQRAEFLKQKGTQGAEDSKAAQDRAERESLLRQVIDARKKIQYAADTIWPPKKATSVQARKDFKLPRNRPYSY